jgi:hypothetical protein
MQQNVFVDREGNEWHLKDQPNTNTPIGITRRFISKPWGGYTNLANER